MSEHGWQYGGKYRPGLRASRHRAGDGQAFEVGDSRLAVYNIGGGFYVTDDECTHASASLADGMLDGDVIECACISARSTFRPAR